MGHVDGLEQGQIHLLPLPSPKIWTSWARSGCSSGSGVSIGIVLAQGVVGVTTAIAYPTATETSPQ